VPDFVDRYSYIMLEYEKVLSDCSFDGILDAWYLTGIVYPEFFTKEV